MTYQEKKADVREKAINFQQVFSECDFSYSEIIEYQDYFLKQGKRYGLLKEFRENGII
jgi:hypothetical protein